MKALSLLQPWAQLVMLGAKRHVARTWKTHYRGILFIHASPSREGRAHCAAEPCRSVLAAHGFESFYELPLGVLLGTVTLDDCLPTEQLLYDDPSHVLASFGDFRPGISTWLFSNPRLLQQPIRSHGACGLFDVSDSILTTNS